MPIKVLFVTTTYPLHKGDSTPPFVADLAKELVKYPDLKIRVIAPHHGGGLKHEIMDGVEVVRFQYTIDPMKQRLAQGCGIPDNLRTYPQAKWQLPAFFLSMAAAVWRHTEWADIIHAHWVEPAFVATLANRAGKPMIITVHSLSPKPSLIYRFALSRADRVLFNSNYTLNDAAKKGYRCKGEIIYQGYDERLFYQRPRANVWRDRLGIPHDARVVLGLGRLIEVKGLHVLAAAAERILAPRPDCHLIIGGHGPFLKNVEEIKTKMPSGARLHTTGALNREQAAELFAEADLFVNPGIVDSKGRADALGVTTIEAMASGLATVGSRVGGLVETIVDGETGVLVEGGNEEQLAREVGRLIDDPALRARMGEAAKRVAKERFTWAALAKEVAGVYRGMGVG